MNDRTMIAAMAMQGMLANSSIDILEPAEYAGDAVRYADALLKALESEAQAMEWRTSDQTVVYGLRYNGELYNAYQPEQSEGIEAPMDEVGDWREYVWPGGESSVVKVSARNMAYVDDAFLWRRTPQGFEFWEAVYSGDVSALTITRAQDFARRVLEAMEASDE